MATSSKATSRQGGSAFARAKSVLEGYLKLHVEEILDDFRARREPLPCLPDSEANQERRKQQLALAKHEYRWNYENELAFIEGLPEDEKPRIRWIHGITPVLIDLARNAVRVSNGAAEDFDVVLYVKLLSSEVVRKMWSLSEQNFVEIKQSLSERLHEYMVTGDDYAHVESMNEYLAMFSSTVKRPGVCRTLFPKLSKATKTPDRYEMASDSVQDVLFAWYRVAGPNPMSIVEATEERMKTLPVTDAMFQSLPDFENDSIEAARKDRRLYMVDYEVLKNVVGHDGKYIYAPKALFCVPLERRDERPLLPVAIQCGPDPAKYPIYTPMSKRANWIASKTMVQVADAFMQEMVFHLGYCHFTLEAFVCATKRCLASNHPVARLLLEHYTGTALINFLGNIALVNEEGTAARILPPQIDSTLKFVHAQMQASDFLSRTPKRDFENRGVTSETLRYPYRDDAIALWDSISDWVTAYLRTYYRDSDHVLADKELQAWVEELGGAGKIKGLGREGKVRTVRQLTELVTMVIFTASAQHSAMNFPQWPLMGFCAVMPFSGYIAAPTFDDPFPWEKEGELTPSEEYAMWLGEMLPPMNAARSQLFVTKLLATMRFTKLGLYPKYMLDFSRPERKNALQHFQQRLDDLEKAIKSRNKEEEGLSLHPYIYLLPTHIPASTNI